MSILRAISVLLFVVGVLHSSRAQQVRVMTLNTWFCGAIVTNGHQKLATEIAKANPDVVFLQETGSLACVGILKNQLPGIWSYCDMPFVGDVAILFKGDRFETIHDVKGGTGVLQYASYTHSKVCQLVMKETNKRVSFINLHLSPLCYGPEIACGLDGTRYGTITETINKCEHRERGKRLDDILKAVDKSPDLSNSPVILGGDLNAPSTLDITDGAKHLHCNFSGLSWPATSVLDRYRFVDAYRAVNPDPVAKPGNTYSPVFSEKTKIGQQFYPQDRIDYIYYRDGVSNTVSAISAEAVDNPPVVNAKYYGAVDAFTRNNDWPSDHRAVVADLVIN